MDADINLVYQVWNSMLERCRNPNNQSFARYGGRGITVCEAWQKSFYQFAIDMGPRPDGYTIERMDNDGNYEPSNCRWASRTDQQRNQSVTRKVVIDGLTYIAAELSEKYGPKTDTIVSRAAAGLPFDEVVSNERRVFTEGLKLGGAASGAKKRLLTHCKNGHEFTEENTHISKQGWRICRACHTYKMELRRRELGKKPRDKLVSIEGKEYLLKELVKDSGADRSTVLRRISLGMPYDKVVSKDKLFNNEESQKKAIAARSIQAKLQTHCKNGHEFTEENTYLNSGRRHCRKCRQAMDKFLYYKKTRPLTDFL